MRSVLRFLLFVLLIGMAVSILYLWTSVRRQGGITPDEVPPLTALDHEFTALVARVLPSVVSIDVTPVSEANPRLRLMQMLLGREDAPVMASGVIVSDKGHVVTNLHVIASAKAVEVHLNDGRVLAAKFVGADAPSDIAILKIDAEGLKPLAFGDSDKVRVGQMVFAVGNPLGLEETVTQGIISAKGRRTTSEAANEFFQTDAAVNQGNSGGPLVDLRGEVIGINNSISPQGQGIGFAIPSNIVRRVFESIRDHGRFIRPWFGASMRTLTPQLARQLDLADTGGALVLQVHPGSPAEKAGLRPWDVIVKFNGRPVRDIIELRNRVVEAEIGEPVSLEVLREGSEKTLETVIVAEPGV